MAEYPTLRRNEVTMVQPNGPMPIVSNADAWGALADATAIIGDRLSKEAEAAKVKRVAELEVSIREQAIRYRNEYAYRPQEFEQAWQDYSGKLLNEVEGPLQEQARLVLGENFNQAFGTLQNEQRARNLSQTADVLEQKTLMLGDRVKALAHDGQAFTPEYQDAFREITSTLQTGVNLGLYAQEAVDMQLDMLAGQAKSEAVIGNLDQYYSENGKEKTKAYLDSLINDSENGLSLGERQTLMRRGDALISDRAAQDAKAVAEKASKLDLAIETTQDPAELSTLLDRITTSVDSVDPIKGDTLRKKVFGKFEKQRKEFEDIQTGSLFATGTAYLNPADTDQVGQFNTFYDKVVSPTLAEMPVDERNTALTNLIDTTKVVPKGLQGDIEAVSKSQDPEEIAAAADLLDRIANQNAHLLGDFKEKDVARIRMNNQFINAGYLPQEAYERTEKILSPENQEVVKTREAALKEAKVDYRGKATDVFRRAWYERILPGDSGSAQRLDDPRMGNTIAQLEADYRTAYDSHYKLTGDEDMSEKHANEVVGGQYGISTVNGFNQIMRFAPEKYYAIPGVPNDWMRGQLREDMKPILKEQFLHPDTNLDEDLVLVPNPRYTSRTAKAGRAEYTVMLRRQDGTLTPLAEGYYFDPNKQRAVLLEEARAGLRKTDLEGIKQNLTVQAGDYLGIGNAD